MIVKYLACAIALVVVTSTLSAEPLPLVLPETPKPNYGAPVPEQVSGRVVAMRGDAQSGVANVSASDGYSVVKTDAAGYFQLTPNEHAVFVFITRPAGYDVVGSWYRPLAVEANFTLAKAADEREFIFVNVSDTHTSNDPRALEGLSDFVREVNAFRPPPRFVINSGDLINLSKTLSDSPKTGDAFFRSYAGIMNNLAMPHYNVAGDHTDSAYRLDEFPRGDHRAGKPQYWEFLGPNFYSFEYGQIHFMSIDSAYHLGRRQLNGREYPTLEVQPMHTAWMEQDMALRSDGTFVVTASETDLVEQCPGFLDMAETNDVRLQLTGDIHVLSEKDHEVPYRTAGALAGCWWNPKCNQLCPDLLPQGYLIYRVDGDKMEYFYKGLGQRVAITSHRVGAPWQGNVVIQAHVVQQREGETLELSVDGAEWKPMALTDRPFYRAVFEYTLDSTAFNDGLLQLQVRSAQTKETRALDVVVVNGGPAAGIARDGVLALSTAKYANRTAAPPAGPVTVLFNETVVGELLPGASKDYRFPIFASTIQKANTVRFEFTTPGDGVRIGPPALLIDDAPLFDVRDKAVRAIKEAHWGDEAVAWGGYNVGDGQLLETPFVRHQDTFCFVLEADSNAANDRGKRWVRSHPFYISGLTQVPDRYDVDAYRDAGLNTLLAWKPREGLFEKSVTGGMPWHYHIHSDRYGDTPEEIVAHARAFVEQYPGCTGLQFGDEPDEAAMDNYGAMVTALREAFPDKLVYSNAYPIGATPDRYYGGEAPEGYGYSEYLDAFAEKIEGDVLMFDIYPFGEGDGHSGAYFLNLEAVRRTALRHGVPYWTYVQAYQHGGSRRLPSESDLRMQIFTSLAYGFTGISYFTYDVAFERGLVELDATPSPLYAPAAQVNPEVAHLGRVLRFLTSTGVGYIPGRTTTDGETQHNPLPPGTTHWQEAEGLPPEILDIRLGEDGPDKDGLIGSFEDDAGNRYFMVVNVWHGADRSAADSTQTITLSLAPGVTSLTRLSRETGEAEVLPVHDGEVELTLPGGTGELIGFGSAFPGH